MKIYDVQDTNLIDYTNNDDNNDDNNNAYFNIACACMCN